MNKILICSIIIVSLISCNNNHKTKEPYPLNNSDKLELVRTDSVKKIILDEETKYNLNYLYIFEEDSIEYLSFLNYSLNQILFYDFKMSSRYSSIYLFTMCRMLFSSDLVGLRRSSTETW